jgi:hypothetical protein
MSNKSSCLEKEIRPQFNAIFIHNQVAEGNQRLLKNAFSAYCYVKPNVSKIF